jgi:hypothetical protein
MNAWETEVALIIHVTLQKDPHLADCDLAKKTPDSTLACAYCGRAQWMHQTRHDTCPTFCWVSEYTITDRQIGQLATVESLPSDIRQACGQALNNYALGPGIVRGAKQKCVAAINRAKRAARDSRPTTTPEDGDPL